jgi:RNA polymerase sigma-70 factor (ECF subfamily)
VADSPGVSETFAELAMAQIASIYNLACWLAGDRAAAEELVEETYTKALKGFGSYQPGTNFRAWMYRILRNTFLTTQAGLKAASSIVSDDVTVVEAEDAPEVTQLKRADAETIRKALRELPLHFREIILLSDLEEMNYKEIGQALSIQVGTVMARLSRARQALRLLLAATSERARA